MAARYVAVVGFKVHPSVCALAHDLDLTATLLYKVRTWLDSTMGPISSSPEKEANEKEQGDCSAAVSASGEAPPWVRAFQRELSRALELVEQASDLGSPVDPETGKLPVSSPRRESLSLEHNDWDAGSLRDREAQHTPAQPPLGEFRQAVEVGKAEPSQRSPCPVEAEDVVVPAVASPEPSSKDVEMCGSDSISAAEPSDKKSATEEGAVEQRVDEAPTSSEPEAVVAAEAKPVAAVPESALSVEAGSSMGDVWMPDRAELQARVLGVGKVAWDKHREKWKRLLRSHPSAEVNVEALEQAVGVAKFLSGVSPFVLSAATFAPAWCC